VFQAVTYFVDGSGVGDIDPAIMRERESLSQDGVVIGPHGA
jgi:mRNA degradation ribonuclease J1/J2